MSVRRAMVVDASIAVAIARAEDPAWAAQGAVRARIRDGNQILVTSHFWLEVSNALRRRHGWSSAAVFESIYELDRLGLVTVDLDRPTLLSAVDLAERHGLTPYDAMYLALADSVDGTLMTLDRALRAAAAGRAVGLDGHRLSEEPTVYEHDVTWPRYKGASAYLAKLRVEAREAATS